MQDNHSCIQINQFRQKPSEQTEVWGFFTPEYPFSQADENRMYSTAPDAVSWPDLQHEQQHCSQMFAVTPPTCVQMRCVVSGAAAPSVWQDKRTSNFGSAATAWIRTPWKGGVWALVFTVSLRVGGVWRILWACVHVCASGMCTVLELTDKGWRGKEMRSLGIKRKRCASLWVEEHVFGCLTVACHDIIVVKEWNMVLVPLFLAYQHSSFLSHSAQRPSGSFCWLGSQHNMFKHQKHTHHPPRLLYKKKKKERRENSDQTSFCEHVVTTA